MASPWTTKEDGELENLIDSAPTFCAKRCLAPWSSRKGHAMPGALAQLLVRERSAKQGWNKSEKETVERMVQISKKRQLEEDEEEGEGENGGEKSQGRKKGRVDELDRTESRFRRLEITDQEEMEESHKSSHTKSSDSAPSLSAQPFDLSKTRRILFPESLSFKDDMDTDADMQEKEFRSVPSVEDEIEDDDDF